MGCVKDRGRVLFVDDDAGIRDFFNRFSNRCGFQVDIADSGFQALELARQNIYSVVVTDLEMPGLDGLTLIERLRGFQSSAQYMVITGSADTRTAEQDPSVRAVLRKPLELEKLRNELNEALEAAGEQLAEPSDAGKRRLLLIEDDLVDTKLFTRYLRLELPQWEVVCATRISEALPALTNETFDLIISDLSLPDARGLEAIDRLREFTTTIPLVVLSSLEAESVALGALNRGAQDYLVKDVVTHPNVLSRSLRYALERKQAEIHLRKLAYYDHVTGVPNRALFKDRVGHALARIRRDDENLALMFCDLDRFKAVNDTFGHDAGDFLLKEIAARLTGAVRESDTIARLGGDEFGILLERTGSLQRVIAIAQRVIESVSQPVIYQGQSMNVGTSIGIAFHPDHGFTTDGLLKSADLALYEAKSSGRGCYRVFNGSLKTSDRFQLEHRLNHALARRELLFHFQPLFNAHTGTFEGCEALMRWRQSDGGYISPAEFIPILEESSQLKAVGRWAVETCFEGWSRWKRQGWPGRLSINLSARQLIDPDFLPMVGNAARAHNLSPQDLEFEITERTVIQHRVQATEVLKVLRERGFRVALDDFGTGYSSLAYLCELPIDTLKIDRLFIQDIETDHTRHQILAAVAQMGKALGLRTVVEGVENLAQKERLQALNFSTLQGYLFSRPIPFEELYESFQRGLWTSHQSDRVILFPGQPPGCPDHSSKVPTSRRLRKTAAEHHR